MAGKIYQAHDFVLNTKTRQFLHHGKAVSLSSKAFDILKCLIENQGQIVKKSELLKTVWSDSFVEESNLPVHISALRRVLGEKRGEQSRFIKTVPGRGYSFVAPVQELNSNSETSFDFPQKSLSQENLGETFSIAVLPITFELNDSDLEYLANGITQSLIDDLSQIPILKVLAYSAVRNYRESRLDLQEIGFLLGANKILTGHISGYKDKLEISVELVNTSDKRHLWSAQQLFDLNDIFRVKKEISLAIVNELKLKLGESDKNSFPKQQEINPEAQKLYFRGKFIWESRTTKTDLEETIRKALAFFQKAVKLEPNYALAHVSIGSACVALYNHHCINKIEASTEIKKAIQMASSTENQLSQIYVLKGLAEIMLDKKFAEAEKSLNQAIKLNSNNAEAYHWKSNVLMILGKFDEAIKAEIKAIDLDPTSLFFNEHFTRIYFFSADYNKAIIQAEEIIEFEKRCMVAHVFLALSYAHLGFFQQALDASVKFIEIRCNPETLLTKAYIHALMNDRNHAEQIIFNVLNQFSEVQIDWANLAYIYSAMSEIEKAFAMLEKAFQADSTSFCLLKIDKRCENLRSDVRFDSFLRKLCLN